MLSLPIVISLFFVTLQVAALRQTVRSPSYAPLEPSSLHRRTLTGQTIAFSCYGGGGDCECPSDLNGDSGVLINVYPGYQCAYPNGACTWDDKVCPSVYLLLPHDDLILYFCADRRAAEHHADELPKRRTVQHRCGV